MRNPVGCHGFTLVKDGQDLACDAHIDRAANKLVESVRLFVCGGLVYK